MRLLASRLLKRRPASIDTTNHVGINKPGRVETTKSSESTATTTGSSTENTGVKHKKTTPNPLTSTLTKLVDEKTTSATLRKQSSDINKLIFGDQTAKKRAIEREEKRNFEKTPKSALEFAIGTAGTSWHLATFAQYPLVDASKHKFKNDKRKLLHQIMTNLELTKDHSKSMRDLILQNNAIQDWAGCDLVKATIKWFTLHVIALETAKPDVVYILSQEIHVKIGEEFKKGGQPAGHRLHQLGSARDVALNKFFGKKEVEKREESSSATEPTSAHTP